MWSLRSSTLTLSDLQILGYLKIKFGLVDFRWDRRGETALSMRWGRGFSARASQEQVISNNDAVGRNIAGGAEAEA